MSSPTWPLVPIQDFAEVATGGTPSTSVREYWDGGSIPWLNSGELNKGVITSADNLITAAGLENSAAQLMPEDSVLVALTGATTGVTALLKIRACANQSVTGILPSPRHHPHFLLHYLRFIRDRIVADSWGGAQKHISQAYVKKLRVPLPPLPEQRRIAEILEKADALRTMRRAAISRLDTLTQSIFLDMFGDPSTNPMRFPRKRLDALVREDDSINYGVVQPGDDCEEGIPLIRVGDLQNGRVDQSALKRISPSIESAYKRSRLRGDEILISCVGSTGMVALADDSVKGFNVARAVARVPLAESVDRTYVASYLQTQSVQRYFANELRTVSQPTLNIKQISETSVSVPPRELQRSFAQRVESVSQIRNRQFASLKGLDAVFASIQTRAFRGEL